uniref:Microtubule-associated protein n=1 Tax=Heterorhabditis bacteriophora TaxID=37862 RepID=A0A1I7XRQ9_HETBA
MDSSSSRTPLDHIIEESRVDENSQSEISPSTEKKSVSSTETSPILRIQEESLSATSWVQPIDEWGAGSKEPTSVASNIIQTQEDEQENTKVDSEETMHIPGDVGSVIDERNTNEKNYSSPDKSIEEVAEQTLHLQKQFACEEGRKITTEKHELPNDGKIRPNSATVSTVFTHLTCNLLFIFQILSKGERRTLKPPTTRIFSAPKKTLASSMPKAVSPVVTRRLPAPTTRTSSTTRIPDSGIIASRSQSQPRAGSYTALNSLQTTPKVNKKYINVTSKIGSITDHKPSGGNVEIFSEKKVIVAKAKVGSMEKADHVPGGGNVKIENVRINFKEKAKPKVDSKSNHSAPKPEKKVTVVSNLCSGNLSLSIPFASSNISPSVALHAALLDHL